MRPFLISLCALLCVAAARPSPRHPFNDFPADSESEEVRSAAIKRLLEVFGMGDPPAVHGHKQPPQYMLDLYNTVADVDGVTRDPSLLEGNTVRSFYDRLRSEQVEFRFNLSSVAKTEKILTAELHLFKLRPQATPTFNRHHFCQVRTAKFRPGQSCRAASLFLLMLRVCVLQVSIYQLMESSRSNSTQEKKLLSARLLPVHSSGWEVFTITPAVRSWMTEEGSNLRLHVVVQTLGGSQVDLKLIRFASGRHHHPSKQPMLVLFTDDGRQSATLESSDSGESTSTLPQFPMSSPSSRSARSVDYSEDHGVPKPCQRLPLYVDFEEIGWSGWIVSPRGYNAYHCKGSCPFPLGQNMRPTNHATVQSIINALKLVRGIETPCCVPDKLHSINLLYFDDDENVVLKQYNDMVAGSCGCH
uniref:Anti-dorsalizing morphogenic protein n=1 Tax=Oryzias latipes TaxID=8090 RepID=A0A3P9LQM0_ORYLA